MPTTTRLSLGNPHVSFRIDPPRIAAPPEPELVAFSLIVPAYNEELAIAESLSSLKAVLSELDVPHEIIVVNDGSSDETMQRLAGVEGIRVVQHERNRGYGAALKTGIRVAQYDWIVITDADGTYPHESIETLLRRAKSADMVVGARTGANVTYSRIRKIPKYYLKRFAQWMTQREIPDINSGMRVFRKDVAQRFLHLFPNGFSFTTTITIAMMTNGYEVVYEPIDYFCRIGSSKIRPIRDTLHFLQLILRLGVCFAPLRVFLPATFALGLIGLASLVYDILHYDLTEKTLLVLLTTMQAGFFALLADMVQKRTNT